jgi:hypothetical protein
MIIVEQGTGIVPVDKGSPSFIAGRSSAFTQAELSGKKAVSDLLATTVETVQNVGVVRPLAEMAGGPSARR